MSDIAQTVAKMLDILPEPDQQLAFEIVKKMLLAWDPDFTKVTPDELQAIKTAEKEITRGETVWHNEIDWN